MDALESVVSTGDSADTPFSSLSDFDLVDVLEEISRVKVPHAIEEIRTAPVVHDTVCEKEEMEAVVKKFLGIE